MIKFIEALIILIFLVPLASNAQIINEQENLLFEDPFFYEKFIDSKNIKSITGEFHYKRDHQKMYNKGVIVKYDFDKNGKLKRKCNTIKGPGNKIDTVFVFYEYNSNGKLTTKRSVDHSKSVALSYIYDKKGNVLQQITFSGSNYKASPEVLSDDKPIKINIDKFEFHTVSPGFKIKKFLNTSGNPYREITYLFNEEGKVIEERNTLLSIRRVEKKQYQYNATGQLVKITEIPDVEKTIEWIYAYNEQGRLIEIRKLKNSEPVFFTQFMLDSQGRVINQLSRNYSEKVIDVIKFRYEFY